jgi:hypothetical protein
MFLPGSILLLLLLSDLRHVQSTPTDFENNEGAVRLLRGFMALLRVRDAATGYLPRWRSLCMPWRSACR